MLFLADENFPAPSIRDLRHAGLDIRAIAETNPRESDQIVLRIAQETNRVLLTFDSDFGRMAVLDGMGMGAGIVFFRFRPESPSEPARVLLGVLARGVVLSGRLTVVSLAGVRQRTPRQLRPDPP